jgi:predicted O-linked N-acetylglucosamine transferase (SPINDLY family)
MTSLEDMHARAWQAYHAGQRAQAEQFCWEMLRAEPLHADAIYLLGVLALDSGRPAAALVHFHHVTLLQPANAAFHNALGEVYRARGDRTRAQACFREALRLQPAYAAAHNALGQVLLDDGDRHAAIASFRQAVAVQPNYERAHVNLGRALQLEGDLKGAEACYLRAIELKPAYAIAHNNLGAVLQAYGRTADSLVPLRRALECQPNYPEAHFNLGNSLLALGDPAAARASYEAALRLRPDYARGHFGLGRALEDLGELPLALASFREAARLNPELAEAHKSVGDLLLLQPDWDGARAALERAVQLQPDNARAFARLAYAKQVLCDWRTLAADLDRLWRDAASSLEAGKPSPIIPFCTLTMPWSAAQQLAIARSHAAAISQNVAVLRQNLGFDRIDAQAQRQDKAGGGRLRVGYLSNEFRDHAVSHLVQGMFALHDREAFEIYGYSFGRDDGSTYRRRIVEGCDVFRDLDKLALEACARRIHDDGIHILIDLQGHTGYSRMNLLALRPAPIQVNYIGHPGTSGADFIDYLIGDPVITPTEAADTLSERLVLLPHCYLAPALEQPSATTASRAANGLPETGFVFCGFANRYKIEPRMFDVWMNVLKRVPASVLWLSPGAATGAGNLRREAQARGVGSERLVFARHLPSKAEHLARHRLAGLYLDTLLYNAHTTACDALWAGLPVLTCLGGTFASRVGASVLKAVGLPELIVQDLESYENLAVRLAQNPEKLAELRARLDKQRVSAPLFDTRRLVRNLERAYRRMWDLFAAGKAPELIVVKEDEARAST